MRATPNPINGDIRSHSTTSCAFAQCGTTPTPNFVRENHMLTPIIDPISACELDTGRANHHAPRSQRIDAMRIDMINIMPIFVGARRISSTGRRWRILIATAIPQKSTPRKLSPAAMRTDFFGFRE